ncbi:HlyD family secretion protein [Solitalea canadensis]|uniref:Uncharacterized protein n=1 Tax=Solitalea canadensis (strain ATCC 29591 / DSM 3403 / JCM 21819 / LMG 8368 / NBRC 15130 / NCIMB 12057 / USAM 9D) TaxID=929556 RepID=H8KUU4_SOLCM|nr:efflux RND transporter periplasmic adaptor subunit [Solitalea canadensis]AFD07578.1 hypothetical protein Solca_2544 [Solitalea canadensis DSM 3403]
MKTTIIFASSLLLLVSCKQKDNISDASGTFETEETIISAEATGTLKQFDIQEGQTIPAGTMIGYIDSLQLYLKKRQLEAQIKATLSKKPDISAQLAALQEQLKAAERDQVRYTNLLKDDATTRKQVDDINSQVAILKRQIAAQQSSLAISTGSISEETNPLKVQIAQTNDQLEKCRIINPITGTVLTKYAERNEMASPGKALYKIADLSSLNLRAYVTGDQLPKIKLNQKVKVLTDNGKDSYKEQQGTIIWINDKAEFTPKTIQTKDERANLVYAVKIKVPNDGSLKIGMYGEVKF